MIHNTTYPFSSKGKFNKDGYNYKQISRMERDFPTDKQLKYIDGLLETCERVGLDLSNMNLSRKTKNDCRSTIRAIITILTKNGYDTHGNKVLTVYVGEEAKKIVETN